MTLNRGHCIPVAKEGDDEETALLSNGHEDGRNEARSEISHVTPSPVRAAAMSVTVKNPTIVFPIALLAALAMAATAATSVFAYATLLCEDPLRCRDSEQTAYAGAIAAATCVANVFGMLMLGVLEDMSKRNPRKGLVLWILCRSMSVVMLAAGGW